MTELASRHPPGSASAVLHYPPSSLAEHHLRAAAGLSLSLGPLLFLDPSPAMMVVLTALAALFLVYCVRGIIRQYSRIEFDEAGIRIRGMARRAIRWETLQDMRIHYYTTRRDGESGWMQLQLRGDGQRIAVDSSLTSFNVLAAVCATRFRVTGRELDDISRTNLASLGVAIRK